MQIRDLGAEAIDEILSEAADGMTRRTGKPWSLNLDGENGSLGMLLYGKLVTTVYVRPAPLLKPVEGDPVVERIPEAIAFRRALRARILEATQALTPVPAAADIPAALVRTWSAIAALDDLARTVNAPEIPGIRHDLHRILDHLTGCDHSGCSGKPGAADYGRTASAERQ